MTGTHLSQEAASSRRDDRAREHLAHAVFEATTAFVNVADCDGRLIYVNRAMVAFVGIEEEHLLGRPFWEVLVLPEELGMVDDVFASAKSGAHPAPECDWHGADGRRRRIAMQICPLLDESGRPYAFACIGVDVTDERQATALLGEQAATDPLTGVRNRGALFAALRRERSAAPTSTCGVLFCDLDDFKGVNDEHGHLVGDRLLTEVAARLVENVGAADLVARFGGDEFVVLRPQTDEADLAHLAGRLTAALTERGLDIAEGSLPIEVSIGWALSAPGEHVDDLIARADRGMYEAKARRRRVRHQRR